MDSALLSRVPDTGIHSQGHPLGMLYPKKARIKLLSSCLLLASHIQLGREKAAILGPKRTPTELKPLTPCGVSKSDFVQPWPHLAKRNTPPFFCGAPGFNHFSD